MKNIFLGAAALAAFCAAAHGSAFTVGDIVIYRVGDSTTNASSAASPVYLNEYSTGGSLVQALEMPTANVNGGNQELTAGTAGSDGELTLSPNGEYLALTGYQAAVGLASVTSAATTATIGIVDFNGNINTATTTTQFAGNNMRSAVTTDGTSIWMTGAASGVRYTTVGSTSSTELTGGTHNFDSVNIFNGQLYASSGKNTSRVGAIGTGEPTTTGQTLAALPGLVTSGTGYGFYMADLPGGDVLYMTDAGTGNVLKYSLVSGSWVSNGSIAGSSLDGLTGEVLSGNVDLYATDSTGLFNFDDTTGYDGALSGASFGSAIATAPAGEVFDGVAFAPQAVPEPQTWAFMAFGVAALIYRSFRRGRALS